MLRDTYKRRGSYGNNTTIPEDEKASIAARGECRLFRGEQAVHHFCQHWGLTPEGDYLDLEGFDHTTLTRLPWDVPINEQPRARFSKSPRNMRKVLQGA